jgi:uncharacterized Ntn-hydrolase superfamily protein
MSARVYLLCLAIVVLGTTEDARPAPRGSTWSIVAVDPASGDMGVAAASCFPGPIDAIAALVPGKGVAAAQANFTLENRDRVFSLLRAGEPAGAIVAAVTNESADAGAAQRQYGVVTLHGESVQVAGFTGADTLAWAGDRQDLAAAVTVQGNILEGEAVVNDALTAFRLDTGPLPDRLLRALEAGSAAGGDRRCNWEDVQQTASAAFIMVARGEDAPFVVSQLGVSEPDAAGAPWLYLSVTEPPRGENPLGALRRNYDAWRAEHLPAKDEAGPPRAPGRPALWLLPAALALLMVIPFLLLRLRR